MPNHIENHLYFGKDKKFVEDFLKKYGIFEEEEKNIDFNKIVPMPESLNIPESNYTNEGKKVYNDFIVEYLKKHNLEEVLIENIDPVEEQEFYDREKDKEKYHGMFDTYFSLGKQALLNYEHYGEYTWYGWAINNWGTKWNAYNGNLIEENGEVYLSFQTAWSPPYEIIVAISKLYPDLEIKNKWCSEVLYDTSGCEIYKNGELIESYYPENDKSEIELYCEIHNLPEEDKDKMIEEYVNDIVNEALKNPNYKVGERIVLLKSIDEENLEKGIRGTVICTDDIGGIHIAFDNRIILSLYENIDSFRKLSDEELDNERKLAGASFQDSFIIDKDNKNLLWISRDLNSENKKDLISSKISFDDVLKSAALHPNTLDFFKDISRKGQEVTITENDTNAYSKSLDSFTKETKYHNINRDTKVGLINEIKNTFNFPPITKEDNELADKIINFVNKYHDELRFAVSDRDVVVFNVKNSSYLYSLCSELRRVAKINDNANTKSDMRNFAKELKEKANELYKAERENLNRDLSSQVLTIAKSFMNDPKDIAEYISFAQRFYKYSARNQMLIFSQNPNAFFVGSIDYFRKQGYFVKEGEKGMKILVPRTTRFIEKEDKTLVSYKNASKELRELAQSGKLNTIDKQFFNFGTVFDISQTTCPKEDYPKYIDIGYDSTEHKKLINIITNIAKNDYHIEVKRDSFSSVSTRGEYNIKEKEIRLSKSFNDSTTLSALSHELGHGLLHNTQDAIYLPAPIREFEADAFSVMLCTKLSVDIAQSRKNHLSDNYRLMTKLDDYSEEMLTKSLDKVIDAYTNISDKLDEHMAQIKEKEFTITQQEEKPFISNVPDFEFTESEEIEML